MNADWMKDDDAISIFNLCFPGAAEHSIPESLRPTILQRSTPHHPWLDVFPFPGMRDNLIMAGDTFNDEELCSDLMAFWDTRNAHAMMLVWGFPWQPENWEITEDFARKWGWLLRGCPEILVSSNRWRERRGERRLNWNELL